MTRARLFAFFFLSMMTTVILAQRLKTVEGYSRIEQSDEMTGAVARAKVIEQARFDAINGAFGSNIMQNNVTLLKQEGEKTSTSFYMMGESDLRGTWIRDKEKPRVEKHVEEGRTIWEAWVKGEAREQVRAKVDFEFMLLANGADDRYQVNELHDGDAFYIKFRSPVNGHLLLFMADDKGVVNCLLPEHGQDYCIVKANQWLLSHYNSRIPEEHWTATIARGKQIEYDQIYVVFSPNKLNPPMRTVNFDNSDLEQYRTQQRELRHISELSFKDFHKYLGKLQQRDVDVQIEKMLVRLSKRK